MSQKIVVIGAGMASGRLLDHLTEADDGVFDITLINAEPRGTYNRIMLSPVLAGEKTYEQIVTHDDVWYRDRGITCHFGTKVDDIDRTAKVVSLIDGTQIAYDLLVIATGSNPFIIPMPGHDLEGVIAYRDLEDTQKMMDMGPDNQVVVIGGGLLGLEAAAGMALRGVDVTVVHLMGHLMERQLDPEAGALLRASLEEKGISVCLEAQSQKILGRDGKVSALKLADGTELPCDLLVMAVGIRPNVGIGQKAGLETGRGIKVDDQMRTSDPDIFAIGECTEHQGAIFGLVAPLFDQAKVLADTLKGQAAEFKQKSLSTKLKVTGCDLFSAGDFEAGETREDIVLRDPSRGVYRRLVLEDNKLVGAVFYGDTSESSWVFNLIQEGTDVTNLRDALVFGPAFVEHSAELEQS